MSPSRPAAQRAPIRILLVDDNPSIHEDFRKILCRPTAAEGNAASVAALEELLFDEAPPANDDDVVGAEFVVDSAYQGEQAVAMVAAAVAGGAPYALAFVDVRMPPGIDGVETLARMWKSDPHLQGVISSAYSDHSWSDMARALGHSDGFLVLRKPFERIEALQIAHALTQKWQLAREVRHHIADLESRVQERTRDLESSNATLRDEVSRRLQAEADLRELATHDTLTGLPNRLLMKERLAAAVSKAQRAESMVALCLLDLDDFKEVNDTYGHAAGDLLLQEISRRLGASVRASDTVARMGGDEFVVICEDVASADQVTAIVRRILEVCSAPCTVAGHIVRTPPSIGVALYPGDATDIDALLKSADLAMYQAKRSSGADFKYYADGLFERSIEQLELRGHLETALENDELALWYQPLIDLRTGRVAGVEALLRWHHPGLGLVPPMKFIPLAEKCELIVPIGAFVVEAACRQLAAWRRDVNADLTVAVNVSAAQLRSSSFVDVVRHALESSGVPARCLELEITESAAMENEAAASSVLDELAALGVRLVIDDFGAGYSSMMRLKTMPIHGLKIDRAFIKDIADDPRDAMIVSAILSMAHSLGLTVVAEGVERPEQLERLKNLKRYSDQNPSCDTVQGFLLGRPMPAEVVSTVIEEWIPAPADLRPTG